MGAQLKTPHTPEQHYRIEGILKGSLNLTSILPRVTMVFQKANVLFFCLVPHKVFNPSVLSWLRFMKKTFIISYNKTNVRNIFWISKPIFFAFKYSFITVYLICIAWGSSWKKKTYVYIKFVITFFVYVSNDYKHWFTADMYPTSWCSQPKIGNKSTFEL